MCVCVCVYVCVYTTSLFLHQSMDIWALLGSFHTLTIVNSAAINIGVHVPLRISTPVPLYKYLIQLLHFRPKKLGSRKNLKLWLPLVIAV